MADKREAPEDLDGDEVVKKQKMDSLNNNKELQSPEGDVHGSERDEEYLSGDQGNDSDDYSESDDYYDMQSDHSSQNDVPIASAEIQILKSEELQNQMKNAVRQVEQKLQVSPSTALILLTHFSWDFHKLCDKYYDESRDEYFKTHGLPLKTLEVEDGSGDAKLGAGRPNPEIECGICFTPYAVDESLEYPQCGHSFCLDCSKEYIKTRITENGLQSTIQCPDSKCNILLKADYIKNVLKSDSESVKRYNLLLIKDYVSKNNFLKYCPGKRCDVVWKLDVDGVPWHLQEVACDCRESYCFTCNNEWHFPLNCKLHEYWKKRMSDESENSSWIIAHTKPCPKCFSNIQKNGGCNHMTCRKCHHQFCWICLTAWSQHRGSYNCNRNPANSTNEAQAAARNHLQRFLFANERFLGHGQSYDFEKNLLEGSLSRMEEIRTACQMERLLDASYYEDAIKGLLTCRKLLQYSFAFVFYLERNSQVEIFETNMINLHEAVENLSHYLEEDQSGKDLGENKLKVLNLTNFCKQRRKVLIDHVKEGYGDGKWDWSFRQDLAPGTTIV